MGSLLSCMCRMFCGTCSICDKPDDWLIANECRAGERGAGWLYKRAKNSAIWSKRYCVLTDTKLIYFMERDRTQRKGEIILAGATASVSSNRESGSKKFYFNIYHPQCGTREMYAKTKNRRAQWVEKINDIASALSNTAVFGKMSKQGGLRHNTWQERWCVCSGNDLDYFETANDNQSKGSIALYGCTVRVFPLKDKFCFEITTAPPSYQQMGKVKDKKYIFQLDKEHECNKWVDAIRRAATFNSSHEQAAMSSQADGSSLSRVASTSRGVHDDEDGDHAHDSCSADEDNVSNNSSNNNSGGKQSPNPLLRNSSIFGVLSGVSSSSGSEIDAVASSSISDTSSHSRSSTSSSSPKKDSVTFSDNVSLYSADGTGGGGIGSSGIAMQSISLHSFSAGGTPSRDLCGYLHKMSPALLKGWQKRYFRTNDNGDISYYKTENDCNNAKIEPLGVICIKDIKPVNGIELNDKTFEITVHITTKSILLKATSKSEATNWANNIAAWQHNRMIHES